MELSKTNISISFILILFSFGVYLSTICPTVYSGDSGELTAAAASHVVTIDNVGMIFLGDDLGFATGTLISPAVLREHIFHTK